ncbi:MAG: class I SAM-dependent RNA methyltransferase, partial [Planctomycetota bacterium]
MPPPPPPFREGDSLEVTPDRLGRRGEAEADHRGWRIRILGGFPGEAARVTITHVSKGARVAVASFAGPAGKAHPDRREPPCPIHATCGGCGMQHVGEPAALDAKISQARRLLGESGEWKDPVASPSPFHYRAKTFMLPQRQGVRLILGARPPRGAELVDTSGCSVLRPELEALAARARATLSRRVDEQGHLRSVL